MTMTYGGVALSPPEIGVEGKLIETGHWDTILSKLADRLNHAGWLDSLRYHAKQHVQNYERDRADANGLRIGDDDREGDNENTDVLFGALLADLDAQGHASIPPDIKQGIMSLIRNCLEKFVE